jgi:hypothetical protein
MCIQGGSLGIGKGGRMVLQPRAAGSRESQNSCFKRKKLILCDYIFLN